MSNVRTYGTIHSEQKPFVIQHADSTDYLLGGSLVMKNGKIDKVLFDGGYAQASAVSNTTKDKFAFYYYNQDHLGNNREVVDANGVVQQVTNYYPFGAPYVDATAVKCDSLQPYKYNGKELDLMHGLNTYDYGARQHDPILARWDRIDPLCEKYYSTSPYVYCMNNPVNAFDPDGKKTVLFATKLPGNQNPQNTWEEALNAIIHYGPVGWATHTFIAVLDDRTNALKGYFTFSPQTGMGITDSGLLEKNDKNNMYQQDFDVIQNYINGNEDENLKNAIEIAIPEGMSSEQFDKKVISTGNNYKPESTTRYLLNPIMEFTANCNKGSYNLLKQSGVSKNYLQKVGSQIPGIKWGWGQDMPWTKEEQQKAWNDYINKLCNGND